MEIDFRNLDKERFENLCKRLILAEYPTSKTVDGSGGDDGVDAFIGNFNGEIRIWQFKFFSSRLNPSRKKQIIDSLTQAKRKHKLKQWTLLVPMEFTPSEIEWFQSLCKKKENKKISLSYINIHELTNLIQKHKQIRDEFFRGEEKEILDRMEKSLKYIEKRGKVERYDNLVHKYTEQISAFKLELLNIDSKNVADFLSKSVPFRNERGFKRFNQVSEGFLKTYYYMPQGSSVLRLNLEDEENPFKLSIPFSLPIEVWLEDVILEESTIIKTQITCFTSHYSSKHNIIHDIKNSLPENIILNEVNFNKKMKSMISDRSKFALTTTTVELDPDIIERVNNETNNKIDVEIRSNIVHSKTGGLPKTTFMRKALSLVKSIRKESKVSEIIFFRAKQTSKVLSGNLVSIEVHNDGRVRIWYKRSIGKNKEDMKKIIKEFINKIA